MAGVYLGVGECGGMSSTLARTPLYVRLCRGLNIKTRTGSKAAGGKIKKEERKDSIRVALGYRWSIDPRSLARGGGDWRSRARSARIVAIDWGPRGRKSRGERGCLSSGNLSRRGRAEGNLLFQPAGSPVDEQVESRQRGGVSNHVTLLLPNPLFFLLPSNLHHLDLPYTANRRGQTHCTGYRTQHLLLHHGQP